MGLSISERIRIWCRKMVEPIYFRIRLKRISKALGITPYAWQKRFVLTSYGTLYVPGGRCTGKTMAAVLRILVRNPSVTTPGITRSLLLDPDVFGNLHMLDATYCEYRRCFEICNKAGLMNKHVLISRPRSYADLGFKADSDTWEKIIELACNTTKPRKYVLCDVFSRKIVIAVESARM